MSVDISALTSLGLTEPAPATPKKNELGQDMFMKLMVTQLKNQNPLKPQEGAEFLSQLAQFSTVSGIQDLQESFSSFATAMNEEQALQAANLVGKSVLISSRQGVLGDSGAIQGEVSLPAAASKVTVRIFDAKGVQVRSIERGPQPAGQIPFEWNGFGEDKVVASRDRVYTIKAEAVVDGETMALDTQVKALVESVKLGGAKGIEIDLGKLGTHALKEIKEIR